jgi:uncharacterized protein (DUF1499 family)
MVLIRIRRNLDSWYFLPQTIALVLVAASVCLGVLAGLAVELFGSPIERDLRDAVATSLPNAWLACTPGICHEPDAAAPAFNVTHDRLRTALGAVVHAEPRTRRIHVSKDARRLTYTQQSATFGFTDRIYVQFFPLERGRSAIAISSEA